MPEIADGLVTIEGVAREPGYRSKIAVQSHTQGVDPVGACVGPRGSRVRMVVSELRGEKIDIIPWNQEPARFVAKALSPARVREVYLDDAQKEATVVVPDDQLALAIGKEGMNARLAHRLTGWKIDIVSDTEFAQQEAQAAFGGEGGEEGDFSGRCSAVLSNGKRCPNAALPGSKYCGVPAHQELALHEPDDEINPIVAEAEPELEALSRMQPGPSRSPRLRPSSATSTRADSQPGRATRRSAASTRRSSRAAPGRCGSRMTPTRESRSSISPTRKRKRLVSTASPIRTCAGCGRKAPQSELQRFHAEGGALRAGPGLGRGAYTCRRLVCFERARARRGFSRTLRMALMDVEKRRLRPALLHFQRCQAVDRSGPEGAAARGTGGGASSSTAAPAAPVPASASVRATARGATAPRRRRVRWRRRAVR